MGILIIAGIGLIAFFVIEYTNFSHKQKEKIMVLLGAGIMVLIVLYLWYQD